LRHDFQHPDPPAPAEEGLVRDLAEYDRAFGLDLDTPQVGQP
jgi:hypothetical protein